MKRFWALLVLVTVLFSGCSLQDDLSAVKVNAEETTNEKVTKTYTIAPEGFDGSIIVYIHYCKGEALSVSLENLTTYQLEVDDPLELFVNIEGSWKRVYNQIQWGMPYAVAGALRIIEPGQSREIGVVPSNYSLTEGMYRIDVTNIRLINIETWTMEYKNDCESYYFDISE